MAKTSLGKVSVLPKGEYSSVIQYSRLDIVTYKGSSYLCIKDSLGIEITNEEYWQLLAQKGDTGETGATGAKGDKGDAGKDFSIYKTYPSISAMESDASNVPEGEFVLIASDVEDTDNAKLYVKSNTGFVYLTDLSGATGIKGEKGDKPINGIDYNTPEEKEEFKNEVVENATVEVEQNIANIQEQAIQEFNSNASTKTNEYNSNTTTKLQEYNTNANTKIEEYNSNATQKTNTFNGNATTQIETFNNNATSKTNDFNSNASSKTDEFNTNYEEKLESINEASTSIEQERVISDGKYARALKTPVTDVESTQIYAENDVVDDLVINGVELTQETREGYNLLNLEKYSYSENQSILNAGTVSIENGILKIDGTNATANMTIKSRIIASENRDLLPAGKYFFGVKTNGYYESSPETLVQFSEGDVTLAENYYLSQWFASCNKGNTTYKKLLLSNNPLKTKYEQYGASPSLDFPSEIQIANEQNIQISNENLLKIVSNIGDGAFFGLNYKINEDGSVSINGTSSNYSGQYSIGGFGSTRKILKLFKNHKYRIYLEAKNTNGKDVAFYCGPAKNNLFNVYLNNDGIKYNDYAMSRDLIINQFSFVGATTRGITRDNLILKAWIVDITNEIPKKDEYIQNKTNDITIPLTNSAIGQYADTIDIKNNLQNKVIQELILTGDEQYTIQSTETNTIRFKLDLDPNLFLLDNKNVNYICNFLHSYPYSERTDDKEGIFVGKITSSVEIYIRVPLNKISSVEEFKTFLSQQYQAGTPVKIYYVAQSPTTNPLPQEVQTALSNFKLYQDLKNIAIDGGSMSFIYNKSLPKTIEEMQDEIKSKDNLIQNLTKRVEALEKAQIDNVTEDLGGN